MIENNRKYNSLKLAVNACLKAMEDSTVYDEDFINLCYTIGIECTNYEQKKLLYCAKKILNKVNDCDQNNFKYLLGLGIVLNKLGEYNEAIKTIERALNLDIPDLELVKSVKIIENSSDNIVEGINKNINEIISNLLYLKKSENEVDENEFDKDR